MSAIAKLFIGLSITLLALWFMGDTLFYSPFDKELFTRSAVKFTGIMAIAAMSFAMILATRPKWLEKHLHGMDKGYRLHKWLGITALVMAVAHWGWADILPELLGWEDEHDGGGRPPLPADASAVEKFFKSNKGLARTIGEYAFYGAVALIVGALMKKWVPYKIFAKVHKVLAVLFIGLAFHAFIFMDINYLSKPVGALTAVLMLAGVISAFIVLFKRTGKSRKHAGEIINITHFAKMGITQLDINVDGWQGHQAGQFAFLNISKDKESHHPFTISSAWDKQHQTNDTISFSIKGLGDYTSSLNTLLSVGDKVTVEGAYGAFTFDNGNQPSNKPQIWVGGGVGVTPFIARLQALANRQDDQQIDFFYSAKQLDDDVTFRDELIRLAEQARVNLHLFPAPNAGRISGEKIRSMVNDWQTASVWFCGGSEMGKAIKSDLLANGLNAKDFEQELFEMR